MNWILILEPIIKGLLVRLFDRCDGVERRETPQEYLMRIYTPTGFPESAIRSATVEVTRADRRARKGLSAKERKATAKLTAEQKRQLAIDHLTDAMNARDSQVTAARALAATMSDEG